MDALKKMQEKSKDKRKMSEHEKNAKMSVLHDLKKMAQDAMSENLDGLKKVTVASDSDEGLQHGLEKAKELSAHMPEMEHELSDAADHAQEEDEEGQNPEHAEHDSYEDDEEDDQMHPDEMAEEAAEAHDRTPDESRDMHEQAEGDEDDMDEDELNAKLEKLMAMKKRKGMA